MVGGAGFLLCACLWVVAVSSAKSPAAGSGASLQTTWVFHYSGSEQTWQVPNGVQSISVLAAGASGGDGASAPGGAGSKVTATIAVKPYQTLYIQVGGQGGSPQPRSNGTASAAGGYNGGGASGGTTVLSSGSGGGGASDVQTTPAGYGSRLIVAGGGGGAGGEGFDTQGPSLGHYDGGAGGYSQGSSNGAAGTSPSDASGLGGGGGQAASPNGGGAGGQAGGASYGAPGSCPYAANVDCIGWSGNPGALGQGGTPGHVWGGSSSAGPGAGGGGGGGYYGGGAGGSGGAGGPRDFNQPAGNGDEPAGGGGGGLGSSLVPPGGSLAVGAYTGNGTVTITIDRAAVKARLKKDATALADQRYENAVAACGPLLGIGRLFTMGLRPVSSAEQHEADDCARAAKLAYEVALAGIDPPDPNFLSVAVPRTPRPVLLERNCRRLASAQQAACRKVSTLAGRLDDALAANASIWATVVTSLNRLNTAAADGASTGQTLQNAALKAYEGELVSAEKELDLADHAWANTLVRLHAPRTLSKAQVTTASGRVLSGKFSASVIRELRAEGVTPSRMAGVLKQAFGSSGTTSIDVVSLLRTRMATGAAFAGIKQDYHTLTSSDLHALISGLAHGHSITQAKANQMNSALSTVLGAKGSRRRHALHAYTAILSRLSQDVRVLLQGASMPVLG